MAKVVKLIDNLRPTGPQDKAFLGDSSALTYTYPDVKNARIPEKSSSLDEVMAECVKMFNGMPDVSSPLTMSNVWPQPNNASIIASMLPLIFAPNIIEGEYAWNVHKAELESDGMLANLFGREPTKAGAIYTYGGSGCWLYGLKYGPDTRASRLAQQGCANRRQGARIEPVTLLPPERHRLGRSGYGQHRCHPDRPRLKHHGPQGSGGHTRRPDL